MSHPKIPGIRWMDDEIPDIIGIPVTLEDKKLRDLGLDVTPDTIQIELYIDLSKLAGVRNWFPTSSEEPSPNECLIDVDGMLDFVADLKVKDVLEAWIYNKRWHNK